jgi:predicted Fe-Mo cluster-binding NifX family protein
MLKIAVPMENGGFSAHFGGAGRFAFFEVDEATRTIVARSFGTPPPHERGAFPMWLKGEGVNVVLAGGMGPRAVQIFNHFGIETVLGIGGGEPEQIVRDYLGGTLAASGEGCGGGQLHDCGEHDGGH